MALLPPHPTGTTSEAQLLAPENTIRPQFYVDAVGDLLSIRDKLSSWDSCTLM